MKIGLAFALALFGLAAPALAQNTQAPAGADTIGDIADKAIAQDAAARSKESAAPAALPADAAASTDAAQAPRDEVVPASEGANVSVDISPGAAKYWGLGFAGLIVVGLIIAAFGLAFYFIPTFVALARKKRNTAAIFAVNLFLGWSFLGWILALVWALAAD